MTFETFETELKRLVAAFTRQFEELTSPGYAETQLRNDFLNPFFRALGWDLENKAGHIQSEREVEIESRTDIAGKAKRADYLFRTDGNARFIGEAKKPREILGPKYAFQAKRYAWNKTLPLAVLSDFEEIKIYVVGGKPQADRPDEGLWKTWHFKEFPAVAREIWNLLSRPSVAAGSIDALLDSLPKRAPSGRGKAKQLYLIKPDRTRALDTEFLGFLDEVRRSLGSDLVKHNPDADIRDVSRLTEAVLHILDRLLFLRICEDRDIDTGMRLDSIVQTWRRSYHRDNTKRYGQTSMFDGDGAGKSSGSSTSDESRESLWYAIVRHFRALDRRPASHVPFFNGQIFKPHFTEDLHVGDQCKELCWVDPATHYVHLTVELKRQILRSNIYGVDIDAQAVEVTQLSLYLKMLENENRTTLQRQRELFSKDTALLPSLENNIKCGNSLIGTDFSLDPNELVRVNAFNWSMGFIEIMKSGGFTAIVGNPPWGSDLDEQQLEYLRIRHRSIIVRMIDSFIYFVNEALDLLREEGSFGMILPDVMLYQSDTEKLRKHFLDATSLHCVANMGPVFDQVTRPACILACSKTNKPNKTVLLDLASVSEAQKKACLAANSTGLVVEQTRFSSIPRHVFSKLPGIRAFIDQFRSRITCKEVLQKKHSIYALHRARNQKIFIKPEKLLCVITEDEIILALDNNQIYPTDGVYLFAAKEGVDVRYLMGILNSRLFIFLYRLLAMEEGRAMAQVKPTLLSKLPIRTIDFKDRQGYSLHVSVITLVEKMLILTPQLRAAVDEKQRRVLRHAV